MKFYFMPYAPNLGTIVSAKHEYSQTGNAGFGMKKNTQNLTDDAEAGIQSTVVWFNGVSDGLKYCKNRGDSVLIRGHGCRDLNQSKVGAVANG
jgi:hypothetical protein